MREIGVVAGALLLGVAAGWVITHLTAVNRFDGTPLRCEYSCPRCGHGGFYERDGKAYCTRCESSQPWGPPTVLAGWR